MSPRSLRSRSKLRRATVITQTVFFGATVGVGVAALAVDTGLMFTARSELQNAADSAALAAASQLGGNANVSSSAIAQAAQLAAANQVAGDNAELLQSDVTFGHATLGADGKYQFQPNTQPHDSVRVKLRRDASVSDGPVSLLFANTFGASGASITAEATAMLVPRDIAVVIDLSGSMNDDSELRHYKQFASETPGEPARPGVQINLRDVWCALNGPVPNKPYMAGLPSQTQYANDTGPTYGQMNNWGTNIVLGAYSPTSDPGLLYLKSTVNCTDAATQSQLLSRGYKNVASSSPSTMHELDCLMKGSKDGGYSNNFRNRAKVILGLAEWRSGKSNSKYGHNVGGDGDDYVEDGELTAVLSYPAGMANGSWNDYIAYVAGASQMSSTDSNFRYRYGLKTFVNYLLEKRARHNSTPQLAACPELPMRSVKDAVQTMIDTIVELETQDHCSLEVFATTGKHEVNLTTGAEPLAEQLQVIPNTLYQRQAGHYDSTTCIGCGLDKALAELTSSRARSAAAKVVILLTDGKPNVGASGMSPEAYAVSKASAIGEANMTIYTVGVGGDANDGFLEQIAALGNGEYFFADNAPDPQTGQPMYVEQLQEIFQELGGKRPVRLIN